ILDRQLAVNLSLAPNDQDAQKLEIELADYVRNNIFLLNRQSFDEAAIHFKDVEPGFNAFTLLFIVSQVTDVSSGKPTIKYVLDELRTFLKTQFEIGGAETIKTLQKILSNELFDFPISVPEITAI